MSLKIDVQSTVIPIEIGGLKFNIDIMDDNYSRFSEVFSTFLDDMSKLSETEADDMELIKEKQKKVFDTLLGEGAFKKLYELTPSLVVITGILTQIVEHLEEEISKKLGIAGVAKKSPKRKAKS